MIGQGDGPLIGAQETIGGALGRDCRRLAGQYYWGGGAMRVRDVQGEWLYANQGGWGS